jgi:hypothetical protein
MKKDVRAAARIESREGLRPRLTQISITAGPPLQMANSSRMAIVL